MSCPNPIAKQALPACKRPHCEAPISSTPILGVSKPQLTSDSRIGPCRSPCALRANEKDRPHGSNREPRPAALSSYGKGTIEQTMHRVGGCPSRRQSREGGTGD